MMGTTNRQQDAFVFIERYIVEHGRPPSFQEVATGIGTKSKGSIHKALDRLRERGFIDWIPRRARSIKIKRGASPPVILPRPLREKLHRYCMAHGEVASAVVADAVALHLDQMEAQHNAPGECEHCGDVS